MKSLGENAALGATTRLATAVNSAIWAIPLILLIFWGSPLSAIVVGAALSLAVNRPLMTKGSSYGKFALQAAIVLLGFNLDAQNMWQVSQDYAGLIASYVIVTLGVGIAVGHFFGVDRVLTRLIAAGTAICGGTAIATLSPVIKARGEHVAVALAIVFFLNMVALMSFPFVGEWLHMTQAQFGVWAALAVHDTSSVVAVAAIYGQDAAEVATTLKLGRTLWLIPLVLTFSFLSGSSGAKIRIPGFIVLFILASIAGSVLRSQLELSPVIFDMARQIVQALVVTALFFIGLECTRQTVRSVNGRVLWLALALWAGVVPLTLLAALSFG